MSRAKAPAVLTTMAVLTMVVAVIGAITTLVLNLFFFDEYDAYGEVSIPGSSSVFLPEGQVDITFTTVVIGGSNGGIPVPELSIQIEAPEGVPQPTLTEDIGSSTTVNNDARVRVWVATVYGAGDYGISTDGNVGAFLAPTLAFGHGSQYWYVTFIFVALFGLAVVDLVIARIWAARVKRRTGPAVAFGSSFPQTFPTTFPPPSAGPVGYVPPPHAERGTGSYVPTDQAVRIEQLNTIARLRDSGALTEAEFEAEKKRILNGH